MSNIYLKNTVEKTQKLLKTYSKLQFSKFKKFVSKLVFGELQLLLATCNQRSGSKTVWLSCFYFEKNYDVLKSNSLCFLLNKNIDANKKQDGIENRQSYTQF